MGGHFCDFKFHAATRAEAIKNAEEHQRSCRREWGDGPYTGHLGTAGVGVEVLANAFPTAEAAIKHIEDFHSKHDLPMLAHVTGTDMWILAGWCSS